MARSQGFQVEVATPLGLPAQGILETASELGATAILLGTRSHSAVRHAFLGNVALEVMEKSRLPVLLQPLPVHDEAAPARGQEIRSLLLATDFSDAAAPATRLAERLALEHGFPVDLVHALEGGTGEERKEEASLRLEGLSRHFRDAGVARWRPTCPWVTPWSGSPRWPTAFPAPWWSWAPGGGGSWGDCSWEASAGGWLPDPGSPCSWSPSGRPVPEARTTLMKIALLSDVHANLPALEAVLQAIRDRGDVDATHHLGDLVGYAPWPDETVALIRDAGITGVAGNYDSTVATGYIHCGCRYEDPAQEALSHLSYAWTLEHTSAETKRWLGVPPLPPGSSALWGASGPAPPCSWSTVPPPLNTLYWTADRSDEFCLKMAERVGARAGETSSPSGIPTAPGTGWWRDPLREHGLGGTPQGRGLAGRDTRW
jgi:hypothetical protein